MYVKLALRNIKRSLKDYAVYFVTIVFSVSILFAFLSLGFSKDVLSLAENMGTLKGMILALSFIITAIVGLMTNYATTFIIKKRKHEFGTYLLLGMEKGQVVKMFLAENLLIGLSAFGTGLMLGMFIFQVFTYIIQTIFESPFTPNVSFSPPATGLSALFFFIMYVMNTLRGGTLVSRMKIVDLIYSARYNEKQRIKTPLLFSAIFMISVLLCVGGGAALAKTLGLSDNRVYYYMALSLACMLGGLYGVYACLPIGLHLLQTKIKKWSYRGSNLFLISQITSKINTTGKTMGVLAMLLTAALCSLSLGFSISAMYKTNIQYESPFDIAVGIDTPYIQSFDEVLHFVHGITPVKDFVDYKIYQITDTTDIRLQKTDILRLSDYNRLRVQLGLDEKQIGKREFIVHSDTWHIRKTIEEELNHHPTIDINGILLSSGIENLFTEPFQQYRINGTRGYALVLPDEICNALPPVKARFVATTYSPAPQTLKGDLTRYIKKEWRPELTSVPSGQSPIAMVVSVKSWSVANGLMGLTTISFGVMYVSLIFFLTVGTILALQQLTDAAEHKYRFDLLQKLGVAREDIKGIVRKQLALYFLLPVMLPVIITLCVLTIVNRIYGTFILVENTIPYYTAISFAMFLMVYGCYFIACYRGFMRNIMRKSPHI